MKKVYHMIIEKQPPFHNKNADMSHTRTEYQSTRQGYAPAGWRCVGVCGYHEIKSRKNGAHDETEV